MRHTTNALKPKPKFQPGQIVTRISTQESVSVLEVKWAGHCYYVSVLGLGGQTSWVLETQLRAPLGAPA